MEKKGFFKLPKKQLIVSIMCLVMMYICFLPPISTTNVGETGTSLMYIIGGIVLVEGSAVVTLIDALLTKKGGEKK